MNIFQRKSSKKVKEAADGGTPKKDKSGRGKIDLFDRAKGGLDALAGGLQAAKNDAEAATEKLHGDVKSGIQTILHKGSGIIDKAKAEFGSHSEATPEKETAEQGSEEQGSKNMEALNAVLDKVKSNPEVVDKVKEEVMSLAQALHLTNKHAKEPVPDDQPNDGGGEESTSAGNTEGLGAVQHVVEEIQAVVAAVQQEQTTIDETGTETEASPEGEKPEATAPEVEKDDPTKRIGFLGFFAMLFERCCSPANKKKD